MEQYIIGIDSGTSGIKAVLFDLNGNEAAKKEYRINASAVYENWYEEDLNEIWEKAKLAIQGVCAPYPKEGIIGIGITAQGDGLWMLDENGGAVRPGCCFCDGRSGVIVEQWEEEGITKQVFDIAGTRLSAGNQPGIVRWMAEHEPETLKKARHILHLKDCLYYRLTGEIASDASDQSLVFLDMRNGGYSDKLFELYGIKDQQYKYPRLQPAHASARAIKKELAAELGISADILVTNGPMDVAACALGAGVYREGECCSIIGTAALHEMVINTPCGDGIFAGMTVNHAMDGAYLRLMASLAGTPNLDWVFDLFGRELILANAKACQNTTRTTPNDRVCLANDNVVRYESGGGSAGKADLFGYVENLVSKVPIGANGVIYHPFLLAGGERAPFFAPDARASFTGLSVKHGMADILRACYEGVAYAMMDCYANMPLPISGLTLCGGGSGSEIWRRMFADALGRPVKTVKGAELGAKGVMVANAVAQGIFKNYEEGIAVTVEMDRTYEPDMGNHALYLKYFELYRKTYEALSESWKLRHRLLFD